MFFCLAYAEFLLDFPCVKVSAFETQALDLSLKNSGIAASFCATSFCATPAYYSTAILNR